MPRLSRILRGPSIWIKRDDAIDLAFGGSKVRALEYTLADAINKGADVIVTVGEIQSNHARLTAAAVRKLGLTATLVIAAHAKPKKYEGNLHLCQILGADIRFATWPKHNKVLEQTVKGLSDKGHTPYILPWGGSTTIGILGYINAAFELREQADNLGLEIRHIFHASTSGGLQTGLTLGNQLMGGGWKVTGVEALRNSRKIVMQKYMLAVNDLRNLLNVDLAVDEGDLSLISYYSEEALDPSKDKERIMNAIRLVARTEGIVLDPQYTGKAMAVLIEMVKQKKFNKDQNIVFVHTGGTPALFVPQRKRLFPIPSGFIQFYRKYGRRYKVAQWLRSLLPASG